MKYLNPLETVMSDPPFQKGVGGILTVFPRPGMGVHS
jgi:hypothetical protein